MALNKGSSKHNFAEAFLPDFLERVRAVFSVFSIRVLDFNGLFFFPNGLRDPCVL